MRLAALTLLTAALCGCSAARTEPRSASLQPLTPSQAVDWRSIATEDDRARLRQWRAAWVRGLGKAQAAGHGPAIAREGALVQPDAAIDWENPPEGNYRCRTIKIGAKSEGLLDYIAYPPFDCRVRIENGLMSFAKLSGSQRPLGLFLPDTSRRMVFLGTLQLGDERRALQYGRDRERDMAAVVERVAEQRWRVVFPYPHFESIVDILELVPATASAESRT
ncbi:MAG TPA: DUF4893 domain-containing protein [Allosphingosinicella sp.]|jgi:hypothetical protein